MKAPPSKQTPNGKWIFRFALLAFVFQGLWLLKQMGYLKVPTISRNSGGAFAFVREIKNELLYQTHDEKKWKPAERDQALYPRNLVMTSKDSTATLELRDHTLITLAPNTLMTLDDSQFENSGALALQVEKGRVYAKSPQQKSQIQIAGSKIQLESNSEVEIRALPNANSEVRVKQGLARIENSQRSLVDLAPDQLAQVGQDKSPEIETYNREIYFLSPDDLMDSSPSLISEARKAPELKKVYVTEESQKVPIAWKGSAEKVKLKPFGKKQQTFIPLPAKQSQTSLQLAPGHYEIQLTSPKGVSETQVLEVIQVSSLKVFSPMDRDRFRAGSPIKFSWAEQPFAKEYRVEFTNTKTGEKFIEPNLTGYFEKSFAHSAQFVWQITSLDETGQIIAKTPEQELTIGENFLAAPKMKTLEIRAPAQKEIPKKLPLKKKSTGFFPRIRWLAWVQLFLGEKAWSEEAPVEAVFRWESVPNAKSYTLEIAKKSDFRNPVIYKKVTKNEFIWPNFEDGIYYWRVAAGDEKDELGLFSEPSKVSLRKSEAKEGLDPDSAFSEGVLIRRRPDLEAYQLPVDTHSENLYKEVPTQSFDEKRFDKKTTLDHQGSRAIEDQMQLNIQLSNQNWTLNGADQLKAEMKSSSISAYHFSFEKAWSRENSLMVDAYYARSEWKPENMTTSEPNQQIVDTKVQILWGDSKSSLRRGLMISTIPSVRRTQASEVQLKQVFAGGPSFYYDDNLSPRIFASYQVGLVAGASSIALTSLNNINYKLFISGSSFGFIGLAGNANLYFVDRSFSQAFGVGLNLGLGF